MSTIFTKIVKGEIPCYKVAENEEFFAFLDIFPLKKGHTLVIPKSETDYFFDIEDDKYSRYLLFAKKISEAIYKSIPCKKVGMAVIGLEVPHAHIHLVPLENVNDLNFANPKLNLSETEFQEICQSIKSNLTL